MKPIDLLFAHPVIRFFSLVVVNLLLYLGSPVFAQDGTWQVHDFPATEVYGFALHFHDKDTGWIVGQKGEADSVLILRTINGGDSWQQQSPEMAGSLKAVSFAGKDTGYAVGLVSPSNFTIILKTENGGVTWTPQVSPVAKGYLNNVHFINPKLGWIVGRTSNPSETRILRTTDGVHWAEQAHPGVSGELKAVHFSDALNGWAIGSGAFSIPAPPILLHTSDGGITWENQNLPLDKKYLFDVFAWDASTCWIAAGSGPGGDDSVHVFKTMDAGAEWTVVALPVHSYAKQIEFLTPAEGYIAVADISDWSTTFYQTGDGGATWTPLGEKLMYRTGKMDMVRGSTIAYALLSKFVGDMESVETKFAKLIQSPTPVLTTIVITPATANLVVEGPSATFIAEGKDQYGNTCPITKPVWTTSGGGTLMPSGASCLYQSRQGGKHTITCTQEGTNVSATAAINTTDYYTQLTTIVITPATANLVVEGPNAQFVAEGKDQYGNSFLISDPEWQASGGTLTPNGTTCTYTAVQIGDHTLICHQQGTTIQGTAAIHVTATGVETEGAVPSEFYLAQNYPNPFNSSTVITYGVKQPSHVILTVYDVLGKKVATLINNKQQAGIYTIRYKADRMITGIYFFKIQMNDFTCVRKMLLAE